MTFAQPLFLIGLVLSAIPIIIHLWFRKRLKKIPFSTLTFLKKTEAKRFGWLRLREIIILLLRCLIIACLFLSLARPRITGTLFRTGRLASVVLIIDNSGSMNYGDRFATARQRAQEAVAQYSPRSEFMVVPLCRPPYERNPLSWISPASAAKRITSVPLSHSTGDIAGLLRQINTTDARHELEYLYIGDGQAINFKDLPADLAANGTFLMTVMPGVSNVGISRVVLKDPVAVPLDRYVLLVFIKNFSRHTWHGTITLAAGEYTDGQDAVVGSENEIPFEFLVPLELQRGTVRIHDDSLSIDNIYYFSKSPSRMLRVLIIGTDTFLRPALLPTETEQSPFTIATVPHLTGINLGQYDVVILNPAENISAGDKIRLENFLGQPDKGVVLFLGDSVLPDLAEFIGACCIPESLIVPRGYVTLDRVDLEHPVFDVFTPGMNLRNTKFFRFYQTQPRGHVIAELTGGYPLITVSGNLSIVSAQFIPQVTDMVYKAFFVPLLHRLIVSTTLQTHDREFYVDDIMNDHETVTTPFGETLRRGQAFFTPGFHIADGSTLGVNVDPVEGDLKPLGPEAARAGNIQQIDYARDIGAQDLSILFLYCALCALALELLFLIIR